MTYRLDSASCVCTHWPFVKQKSYVETDTTAWCPPSKVQQRGVKGTKEILQGLVDNVEISNNKVTVADLTINKWLGMSENKLKGATKKHTMNLFLMSTVISRHDVIT